jgi:transcriptional regulator with XRE-family HTH domain
MSEKDFNTQFVDENKPSSFGSLIRTFRLVNQLSLQELSERTHVDEGTISRIENNHTKVTLDTAIRLCKELDLTYNAVFYHTKGIPLEEHYYHFESFSAEDFLTMKDIENFVTFIYTKPKKVVNLLGSLLKEVYDRYIQKHPNENINPPLESEDINRLLTGASLYRFSLQYPLGIQHLPEAIAAKGGVVTPEDVGQFLNLLFLDLRFAYASKETKDALQRLGTTGLGRVKLRDILQVNFNVASTDFLALCWSAGAFGMEMERIIDNHRQMMPENENLEREWLFTNTLIDLFRWIYVLDGANSLLPTFRQEIMPK